MTTFTNQTPSNTRIRQALSNAFDSEFALESLKSDKLRVTILIGAIISTASILLILFAIWYERFQRSFHGNFRAFLLNFLVFLSGFLIFLFIELRVITRMIKERAARSGFMPYLSAFVETSIPTIGMILGSQFLGPVYTLFTPAAFLYPLFILLSVLRLDFRLCVFTGAVAAIEYSSLALAFINKVPNSLFEPILSDSIHHLVKGFILLLTGLVAGLVALQIKKQIIRSFEMVDERNRISRTFGEYVSPVVMDKLLTLKPDLRSEKRNVCIMFLDIRDFTSFAEKRNPEEVVSYLESLFGFMVEIVNRHHGVINKFLGDGFMAVFGAPLSDGTDCFNGVAAAKEIIARVDDEVTNGTVLPTRVGIGLHAGEAVTGSIGSSLRREYTVIGDVVNLASRIEKLNKQFGSQLLISEMVWAGLSDDQTKVLDATPMGEVQVRGRQTPIQLFQMA